MQEFGEGIITAGERKPAQFFGNSTGLLNPSQSVAASEGQAGIPHKREPCYLARCEGQGLLPFWECRTMAKKMNASGPLVKGATLVYKGENERFSSKNRSGKPDGNQYGKRTGLSMAAYVTELLAANAKAERGDDELMAELQAEFPSRPAIQAISAYRSYFNRGYGGLNPGEVQKPSLQYARATGQVKAKRNEAHPNHVAATTRKGKAAAKGKAAKGKAAKGKAAAAKGKPARAAKAAKRAPAKGKPAKAAK